MKPTENQKKQNMQEIRIRIAQMEDAEALLAVYSPYVRETAITFEYEVPTPEEFGQRIRHTKERYPYLVAELNETIVGYAYASLFHERKAYDWAVETSIYVDRDKKGMGIGRKLYDMLEMILKEQNILNLNACIAYPEEEDEHLTKDSVKFHEHLGYHMAGEFHQCGYKFHRWYHMVWMEKHIGPHLENQPDIKPFKEIEEDVRKKYGLD